MTNPYLGVGLGLRRQHFDQAVLDENLAQLGFYELLSENFMNYGGRPRQIITQLRAKNKTMVCHGVGLSLGSSDDLDLQYMESLKELLTFIKAPWFSDHLSFASHNKIHFHDLIPILRTKESLAFLVEKIKKIQDYFGINFAFENSSYYAESSHQKIPEEDFICELVEKSGCFLLLDVNNLYVNSINHQFDAIKSLQHLPLSKVIQIHLAGHWDRGDQLIDTHGAHVSEDVWKLYATTLKLIGSKVSTLIEWDNDIPSFETLLLEARRAQNYLSIVGNK